MNLYFSFEIDGKQLKILYGVDDQYCKNFDSFCKYMRWAVEHADDFYFYEWEQIEEDEVCWSDEFEIKGNKALSDFYSFIVMTPSIEACLDRDKNGRYFYYRKRREEEEIRYIGFDMYERVN